MLFDARVKQYCKFKLFKPPEFAASLIIELWDSYGGKYVRLRYNGKYHHDIDHGGISIKLDKFEAALKEQKGESELEEMCDLPKYEPEKEIMEENSIPMDDFNPFFLLLVTFVLLATFIVISKT